MGRAKIATIRITSLRTPELIAYYATVAAFFVASFFPQYRVWGINWWAYFPLWVKFGLLSIGLVAPLVINRVIARTIAGREDILPSTYRWLVGGFAVAMIALFYLLRARTYFLGDGFSLLGLLGSENPFIKPRNLGGTIFQYWIFKLMGGTGENTALLAYQIVSIVAGILFLASVVLIALKLIPHRLSRLIFVLCVCSGGYTLLFFGYVENYSLFSVAILSFTGIALLVMHQQLSRWWILPIQGMAIFLHIFGVVLIPATLYLLLAGTKIGSRLAALKVPVRIALGGVICLGAVAALIYAYANSFFFRLSLLPLVQNTFTVEGYTLFSANHLIDYLNLLLVLFPGIAVGVLPLFTVYREHVLPLTRFVPIWLIISGCAGAAFIFSPGLGMPRDWDLFALAGIPIVVAAAYLLAGSLDRIRSMQVCCLVAVLGCLVLWPRAVVFAVPEISVRHIEAYTTLDVAKSGTTRFLLSKYLRSVGDSSTANSVDSAWFNIDPDSYRMNSAVFDHSKMDTTELLALFRTCAARNPLNWTAWGNIGVIALRQGRFDSALYYLNVSDGLNPYNASTNLNLGFCFFKLKKYDDAEARLSAAVHLDTTLLTTDVLMLMADLYRDWRQETKYVRTFVLIAERLDAPAKYVAGWIELLLKQGKYARAADRIQQAMGVQIDSSYVRILIQKYPDLKRFTAP